MQPQRSVLSRLFSRWAQILFLSLLVSIPVACLIWYFVEPTYEAFSILRVEPAQPKLYSDRGQDNVDFKSVVPYLQTQIKLMTSDRVLEPAVAVSSVAKLPVIAKSQDPKADIRKKMDVEILEDSYLIRVALELPNGDHAAKIVNAVVDSYLSYNKDYKHGANAQLKANLQLQLEKLENELETKRGELQALHQKGTVEIDKPKLNVGATENDGDRTQPTFSSLPAEQIQTIVDQMVKSDLELIATRAALDARQAANRQSPETINELKIKLDELTRKREALVKLFEQLKIEKKEVNSDTFQYTVLNYEAPEPATQTGAGHSEPCAVEFRVRAGQFPGGPGPPSLGTENREQQLRDQVLGGGADRRLVRCDRTVLAGGDQCRTRCSSRLKRNRPPDGRRARRLRTGRRSMTDRLDPAAHLTRFAGTNSTRKAEDAAAAGGVLDASADTPVREFGGARLAPAA